MIGRRYAGGRRSLSNDKRKIDRRKEEHG